MPSGKEASVRPAATSSVSSKKEELDEDAESALENLQSMASASPTASLAEQNQTFITSMVTGSFGVYPTLIPVGSATRNSLSIVTLSLVAVLGLAVCL